MDKYSPDNGHRRGVTHHLPHRTRYRLASHHRNSDTVNKINDSLKKVPAVKNVEFNARTGSLLIHHDEMTGAIGTFASLFENIAGDLFEELAGEELSIIPSVSLAAELVGKRFARINQYLARKTNNFIDFKMLLPVLLAGAGLYQISKERGLFSQMPAWVLFYYAYDSYLKLNVLSSHSPVNVPGNGHKVL